MWKDEEAALRWTSGLGNPRSSRPHDRAPPAHRAGRRLSTGRGACLRATLGPRIHLREGRAEEPPPRTRSSWHPAHGRTRRNARQSPRPSCSLASGGDTGRVQQAGHAAHGPPRAHAGPSGAWGPWPPSRTPPVRCRVPSWRRGPGPVSSRGGRGRAPAVTGRPDPQPAAGPSGGAQGGLEPRAGPEPRGAEGWALSHRKGRGRLSPAAIPRPDSEERVPPAEAACLASCLGGGAAGGSSAPLLTRGTGPRGGLTGCSCPRGRASWRLCPAGSHSSANHAGWGEDSPS